MIGYWLNGIHRIKRFFGRRIFSIAMLSFVMEFCQGTASGQAHLLVPVGHAEAVSEPTANGLQWAVTLGNDGSLCLWDGTDGRFLARTQVEGVSALTALPGSRNVLTGDRTGTLKVLPVDSFTVARTAWLDGQVLGLSTSAPGDVFAVVSPTGQSGVTEIWRVAPETLAATKVASLPVGFAHGVTIDEEGKRMALSASGKSYEQHRLIVIDLASGRVLLTEDEIGLQAVALTANLVAVSTADNLSSIGDSGHIKVITLGDHQEIAQISRPHMALGMSFDPKDANLLRTGYRGGNAILDLKTGKPRQENPHKGLFTSFVPTQGGLFAIGPEGLPAMCNVGTLYCQDVNVVSATRFSAGVAMNDGSLLLAEEHGFAVRVRETIDVNRLYYGETLGLVRRFGGKDDVFALGTNDATMTEFFANRMESPLPMGDLIDPAKQLTLAASPDGRFLAVRIAMDGNDRGVTLLDLTKAGSGAREPLPAKLRWAVTGSARLSEMSFAFAPDGHILVAIERATGVVHRFDTTGGVELRPLATGSGERVTAWALNPAGDRIVIAHGQTATWMELSGSERSRTVVVAGRIVAAALREDGTAVLGASDGQLLAWDGGSGAPVVLATLDHAPKSMVYVAGRSLVVIDMVDHVAEFVDAKSGATLLSLALFANGRDWLAWTPAGQFDASDHGWQGLKWKIGGGSFGSTEPIEDFRNDFYVPGLVALALRGDMPAAPLLQVRERRAPTLSLSAAVSQAGRAAIRVRVSAPPGVVAQDMRLFRNGVLIKGWDGTIPSGTTESYVADLVAGRNHFTAYVFNQDKVKSIDASSDITGAASLRRPGELWVLAIGINGYANPDLQLNYAKQDAALAAAALSEQRADVARFAGDLQSQALGRGDDSPVVYEGVSLDNSTGSAHIRVLLDGEATRAGILSAIQNIAHQAKAEDALVVYYAGHGVALDDRYYLLPQEFAAHASPKELLARGASVMSKVAISDEDLRLALKDEQAAVAAIILDSCQSGQVMGDAVAAARGPSSSRGLTQMAFDKHIYLLAAALSTQTAAEQKSLGHGVLTASLIERGLLDDQATAAAIPGASVVNSLENWLRWGAEHIDAAVQADGQRGITPIEDGRAIRIRQQPRLFSPAQNDAQAQVVMAVRAIPWDPLTLTSMGYQEGGLNAGGEAMDTAKNIPPASFASSSTALLPAAGTGIIVPAATVGLAIPGPFGVGGHTMLVLDQVSSRLLNLDLEHGAILSQRRMPEGTRGFDVSSMRVAAFVTEYGAIGVLKLQDAQSSGVILVPGAGQSGFGYVHWLRDGTIIALHDSRLLHLGVSGAVLASAKLPQDYPKVAALSPGEDWLYIAMIDGTVLSYHLPSLGKGPVLEEPANPVSSVGNPTWPTVLLAAPSGKMLLRVLADGNMQAFSLPGLLRMSSGLPKTQVKSILLSADGSQAYVSDRRGSTRIIMTESGAVHQILPLRDAEQLALDEASGALVGFSDGGFRAWSLTHNALLSEVPDGDPMTFVSATQGGLDVAVETGKTLLHGHWVADKENHRVGPVDLTMMSNGYVLDRSEAMWVVANLASTATGRSAGLPLRGGGMGAVSADERFFAWAPAGARGAEGWIDVYDLLTGKNTWHVSSGETLGLAVNERSIATVEADPKLPFGGAILRVTPMDGGGVTTLHVESATSTSLALSAEGDRIATANLNGDVRVYDVAKRTKIRSINVPYQLTMIRWLTGTRRVLLVTLDGKLMVWNPAGEESPHTVGNAGASIVSLAFLGADKLVAGTVDGAVAWFELGAAPHGVARSSWVPQSSCWMTQANDGRFEILGAPSTLVGVISEGRTQWMPADRAPGYTTGLVQELVR